MRVPTGDATSEDVRVRLVNLRPAALSERNQKLADEEPGECMQAWTRTVKALSEGMPGLRVIDVRMERGYSASSGERSLHHTERVIRVMSQRAACRRERLVEPRALTRCRAARHSHPGTCNPPPSAPYLWGARPRRDPRYRA